MVPGWFVGAAVKGVLRLFMGYESVPDPFSLRLLFGIDTISKILSWIFYFGMTAAVQGAIAGAVAIVITGWLFRSASVVGAALVTGALYTAIVVFLFALTFFEVGITHDVVISVFQMFGLWVGLISGAGLALEIQGRKTEKSRAI
jgi:hypothetical protein